MNPYVVERLAEARHRELVGLARAEDLARRSRRAVQAEAVAAGVSVRRWRRSVARGLISVGLRVGLPPQRRTTARGHARALLGGDELVGREPSSAC